MITRSLLDYHIWSHIFFVFGFFTALYTGLYELAALVLPVIIFSVWFHIRAERPGIIADVDRLFARILFVYGTIQIFYSPTSIELAVETLMAILTVGIWRITIQWPIYNERYHPLGLHVIPGLWTCLVAWRHPTLFMINNPQKKTHNMQPWRYQLRQKFPQMSQLVRGPSRQSILRGLCLRPQRHRKIENKRTIENNQEHSFVYLVDCV